MPVSKPFSSGQSYKRLLVLESLADSNGVEDCEEEKSGNGSESESEVSAEEEIGVVVQKGIESWEVLGLQRRDL